MLAVPQIVSFLRFIFPSLREGCMPCGSCGSKRIDCVLSVVQTVSSTHLANLERKPQRDYRNKFKIVNNVLKQTILYFPFFVSFDFPML